MAAPVGYPLAVAQFLVMHMGALHPYEKVLTVLLAFGPFLLLGVVIVHRRRREAADADSDEKTTTVTPAVGERPGQPAAADRSADSQRDK